MTLNMSSLAEQLGDDGTRADSGRAAVEHGDAIDGHTRHSIGLADAERPLEEEERARPPPDERLEGEALEGAADERRGGRGDGRRGALASPQDQPALVPHARHRHHQLIAVGGGGHRRLAHDAVEHQVETTNRVPVGEQVDEVSPGEAPGQLEQLTEQRVVERYAQIGVDEGEDRPVHLHRFRCRAR
jgi:hypothetical protein